MQCSRFLAAAFALFVGAGLLAADVAMAQADESLEQALAALRLAGRIGESRITPGAALARALAGIRPMPPVPAPAGDPPEATPPAGSGAPRRFSPDDATASALLGVVETCAGEPKAKPVNPSAQDLCGMYMDTLPDRASREQFLKKARTYPSVRQLIDTHIPPDKQADWVQNGPQKDDPAGRRYLRFENLLLDASDTVMGINKGSEPMTNAALEQLSAALGAYMAYLAVRSDRQAFIDNVRRRPNIAEYVRSREPALSDYVKRGSRPSTSFASARNLALEDSLLAAIEEALRQKLPDSGMDYLIQPLIAYKDSLKSKADRAGFVEKARSYPLFRAKYLDSRMDDIRRWIEQGLADPA